MLHKISKLDIISSMCHWKFCGDDFPAIVWTGFVSDLTKFDLEQKIYFIYFLSFPFKMLPFYLLVLKLKIKLAIVLSFQSSRFTKIIRSKISSSGQLYVVENLSVNFPSEIILYFLIDPLSSLDLKALEAYNYITFQKSP